MKTAGKSGSDNAASDTPFIAHGEYPLLCEFVTE